MNLIIHIHHIPIGKWFPNVTIDSYSTQISYADNTIWNIFLNGKPDQYLTIPLWIPSNSNLVFHDYLIDIPRTSNEHTFPCVCKCARLINNKFIIPLISIDVICWWIPMDFPMAQGGARAYAVRQVGSKVGMPTVPFWCWVENLPETWGKLEKKHQFLADLGWFFSVISDDFTMLSDDFGWFKVFQVGAQSTGILHGVEPHKSSILTVTGWWFGTFWNMDFYFSIYWEFHHPNWRTHIFQRGRSTTNQVNNLEFYPRGQNWLRMGLQPESVCFFADSQYRGRWCSFPSLGWHPNGHIHARYACFQPACSCPQREFVSDAEAHGLSVQSGWSWVAFVLDNFGAPILDS